MPPRNHLGEIEKALDAIRLRPERVEETFNVKQGRGHTARKAHVDPSSLLETLAEDEDRRRRQIGGFASGVKHALLEPTRSDADQWDFIESAGGLVPAIQPDTFEIGVEAAVGERAWVVELVEDLVVSYFIQLDRGLRVLTRPQVDRWGVSDDRITAGARSMLYHKSDHLDFQSLDGYPSVLQLRAGDGWDAARFLVVGDVFFSEISSGFRFAIPSPDHFLCVREATAETVDQLTKAASDIYAEAEVPLTTTIFELHTGTPVPVEEQRHE